MTKSIQSLTEDRWLSSFQVERRKTSKCEREVPKEEQLFERWSHRSKLRTRWQRREKRRLTVDHFRRIFTFSSTRFFFVFVEKIPRESPVASVRFQTLKSIRKKQNKSWVNSSNSGDLMKNETKRILVASERAKWDESYSSLIFTNPSLNEMSLEFLSKHLWRWSTDLHGWVRCYRNATVEKHGDCKRSNLVRRKEWPPKVLKLKLNKKKRVNDTRIHLFE